MLHQVAIAEHIAIDPGGLLDDRQERDHHDNASEVVDLGMLERERQARERLAAAGGRGQRKQAGWGPRGREAGGEDSSSELAQRRIAPGSASQLTHMGPDAIKQGSRIKLDRLANFSPEMSFGIEVVGVDQAGKQHPDQQIVLGLPQLASVWRQKLGEGRRQLRRGVRPESFPECRRMPLGRDLAVLDRRLQIHQIVQTRVVAVDHECQGRGQRRGVDQSRRRAVNGMTGFDTLGPAMVEVLLKLNAIFPEIMQPTGPLGQINETRLGPSRHRGEVARQSGHLAQMVVERMLQTLGIGGMSK